MSADTPKTITLGALTDGTYSDCAITVTDGVGNESDPLSIPTFTIDTTKPTITLVGNKDITILVGEAYTDAGATATDPRNTDYIGTISTTIDGPTSQTTFDSNVAGDWTFTYTAVADRAGNTPEPVTRTVTVITPVAVNDIATTNEDVAITFDVIKNDSDLSGGTLSISSPPSNGSAVVSSNKEITYTPNKDFNGSDSLTYSVTKNAHTYTATVNITITPVNDAPTAPNESITIDEDAPAHSITPNITDIDGETPTITLVTSPSKGSITFTATTILYKPKKDENGIDSFDYTVVDGDGETDTGTITITINPVNDAPKHFTTTSVVLTITTIANIDLSVFFTDSEGDALTYSVSSSDESKLKTSIRNSILTLFPEMDGTVTLEVIVSDGTDSITQSYTVEVYPELNAESKIAPAGRERAQKKTMTIIPTGNPSITYKQIDYRDETTECDALGYLTSNIPELTLSESNTIIFDKESDNGDSICFKLTQDGKNDFYHESDTIVGIDTTKPIIVPIGRAFIELTTEEEYIELGSYVVDNYLDYDSGVVSIITNYDGYPVLAKDVTNTPGTYTVTYRALPDRANNIPDPVTKTITVVDAFNLDFDGDDVFTPSQDALSLYLVTQLGINANILAAYVHDRSPQTASKTITLIDELKADTVNTPLDFDGDGSFIPSQDALALYLVTQLSVGSNILSSYVHDGSPATASATIIFIDELIERTN